MPKISPVIPNEILLKELDSLDGSILIIPEQCGMLIGSSKRQLKDDRKNGSPPPYVKKGGSNMYRIEDVRNYLKSLAVYQSTSEEFKAKLKERGSNSLGVHLSFADFLNNGSIGDSWTFTLIHGKPIDFIASLSLQIEDEEGVACRNLTLDEYLDMRLRSANIERSDAEGLKLAGTIGDYPIGKKPPI